MSVQCTDKFTTHNFQNPTGLFLYSIFLLSSPRSDLFSFFVFISDIFLFLAFSSGSRAEDIVQSRLPMYCRVAVGWGGWGGGRKSVKRTWASWGRIFKSSLESIPGLLKRLRIQALLFYKILKCCQSACTFILKIKVGPDVFFTGLFP